MKSKNRNKARGNEGAGGGTGHPRAGPRPTNRRRSARAARECPHSERDISTDRSANLPRFHHTKMPVRIPRGSKCGCEGRGVEEGRWVVVAIRRTNSG